MAVNGQPGTAPILLQLLARQEVELVDMMVQRAGQSMIPMEFTVQLKRPANTSLGIRAGVLNGSLVVHAVRPGGPLDSWNALHPDRRVESGDQIIRVNGRRGAPGELAEELVQQERLDISVRRTPTPPSPASRGAPNGTTMSRPAWAMPGGRSHTPPRRAWKAGPVFPVRLRVPPGAQLLGLKASTLPAGGDGLVVETVASGSIIESWNFSNPSRRIGLGDRILAVNGCRGHSKVLLEELSRSSELELLIHGNADMASTSPRMAANSVAGGSSSSRPPRSTSIDQVPSPKVTRRDEKPPPRPQRRATPGIPLPSSAMPVNVWFQDPRARQSGSSASPRVARRVGIIAFGHPSHAAACDALCGGAFLAATQDMGSGALQLEAPCDRGKPRYFRNAEASFQATMFWPLAGLFAELAGAAAAQKAKRCAAHQDPTHGGFGNSWCAMHAVLQAKFFPDTPWSQALLSTGDAFLLECSGPRETLELSWPREGLGDASECTNWLGALLMLVRDSLSGHRQWSDHMRSLIDTELGRPRSQAAADSWRELNQRARSALEDQLDKRGGGR